MTIKSNKKQRVLLLACSTLLVYLLWLLFRPVEIVAVHSHNTFSDVLVKSFHFTDKGKIDWWLANRAMLKEQYNIPDPDKDGSFSITFWLFGDGYKEEEDEDRLCFDDMKTKKRCIEKDAVFTVSHNWYNQTFFTTYNGRYMLNSDETLTRIEEKKSFIVDSDCIPSCK